jgi:ABC-2 type transport system permease protein
MGIKSAMEYRADFLLSIFSGGFIILIQCFLWTAIFESSTNTEIYGYTYPEMISYSIMSGLIAKIVSTGFEWEIAEDIKNGGLNKFIVQPIGYFLYRISCFLGKKAIQMTALFILTMIALVACSFFMELRFELVNIILFLPCIILATLLNFLIYYCLSTLAFIMTEVWGVFIAASQAILMLSGGIFPLDVFGNVGFMILSILPFKYLIFYPANIINGKLSTGEIISGVLIQSIWILIFLMIDQKCWKWGLKRYVAVGG